MESRLLAALAAGLLFAGPAFGDPAAKKDQDRMQGTWALVMADLDGQPMPEADVRRIKRSFVGGLFLTTSDGTLIRKGTFTLDPDQKPKAIDVRTADAEGGGLTFLGIYEFEEDQMRTCVAPPGRPRPTRFRSERGSGDMLYVWKREPGAAVPEAKLSTPAGPPPVAAVVGLKDGRLRVREFAPAFKTETQAVRERVGGKEEIREVSYSIPVARLKERLIDPDGVRVQDREGKKTEPAAFLLKVLGAELPVLVSADGKPVDPFYLLTCKSDTFVLVLPAARTEDAQPAPARSPDKKPEAGPKPDQPGSPGPAPQPLDLPPAGK